MGQPPADRSGYSTSFATFTFIEPFLTLREAAEILRLHPRTVKEYVRRGELKGRVIGGRWRFRRKNLDAFFEAAPSQWEIRRKSDNGE